MAKSSKSKIKVPKRLAGVKIPKAVRKGPVLQFVNSSAGKLLLAEAITAALAAMAYKNSDAVPKVKGAALNAEAAIKENGARLVHAFSEGVRAFREALGQPMNETGVPAAEDAEDVDVEPLLASKKNPRRSSANQQP